MHLWENMFFTEFTNRSMSYKESQQQIHVSDHTQTILGGKEKRKLKGFNEKDKQNTGCYFLKNGNVS